MCVIHINPRGKHVQAVDRINAIYHEIAALTIDELRQRTQDELQSLQDAVAEDKTRLVTLKSDIENLEIDER